MGKGHRDNHAARMKRGPAAFKKKAKRRANDAGHKKCMICGWASRITSWEKNAGICPHCHPIEGTDHG